MLPASLHDRHGILKPKSPIEEHIRSTAASFLRGLRGDSLIAKHDLDLHVFGRQLDSVAMILAGGETVSA